MADTKFEFGFADGELILIDEVGTPDSSRFWPADDYAPGGAQPSFDKQFVRDLPRSDGVGPGTAGACISHPRSSRARRRDTVEAYDRITGEPFDAYLARAGVMLRDDDRALDDDPALERLREERG